MFWERPVPPGQSSRLSFLYKRNDLGNIFLVMNSAAEFGLLNPCGLVCALGAWAAHGVCSQWDVHVTAQHPAHAQLAANAAAHALVAAELLMERLAGHCSRTARLFRMQDVPRVKFCGSHFVPGLIF